MGTLSAFFNPLVQSQTGTYAYIYTMFQPIATTTLGHSRHLSLIQPQTLRCPPGFKPLLQQLQCFSLSTLKQLAQPLVITLLVSAVRPYAPLIYVYWNNIHS